MADDKITEFELTLIELNRNVAYKNKDDMVSCYERLKNLYTDILNSDVQLEKKQSVYRALLRAHNNIANPKLTLNVAAPQAFVSAHKFSWTNPFALGISAAALIGGTFLITNPESTGMAVASSSKINPYFTVPLLFILAVVPLAVILIGRLKHIKKII